MNPPDQQCAQCGKPANPNAKFCPSCGARLTGAAPQVQRLQPGHFLQSGRYRILRTLGKGGMGLIYVAQNKQAFDRLCVIKEMLDYFDPNDRQQTASAHQRFEDEARTLSRLNHPGIPGIQAYFSEAGHNYIVMDFVDGQNLEQMLGRKLSENQIVNYGMQVCDILKYLADLNPPVVHHDIKPANIIIDAAANRARLVDFGTAKARLTIQAGGGVGLQKSSIYGTAGYAPPEQYKGQSEPRSDVYALAATMYHLITDDDPGLHPFSFPRLDMLSPGLRTVLKRCFEDLSQRSTAQVLRRELQDLLTAAAKTGTSRKSASARTSLGKNESYAVVSLRLPPALQRWQVSGVLQKQLGVMTLDAEGLTWRAPVGYLRHDDGKRAQTMINDLRAVGFDVNLIRTSQVLSWRVNLAQSSLQQLVDTGEVAVNWLYFPQDRICSCHACGHQWTTQAQDISSLRTTCTKCSHPWYLHRIFRCHICGHEFAHADMNQAADTLYAKCPACNATWLPRQQLRLAQTTYTVKERLPSGSTKSCQITLAALPNNVSIQGRAFCSSQWLQTADSVSGGKVNLTINSTALAQRQTFETDIWAITNAGNAIIKVSVYVEAPAQLLVDPKFMDFGELKAQETRSFELTIRNAGDMELTGRLASSSAWLRMSKSTFRNRETIRCQVMGSQLEKPGVNTATLLVESNGGNSTIPVKAVALPTTLEIEPQTINLGRRPNRSSVNFKLAVSNTGFGLLEGEASADAPWIQLEQPRFTGNATHVKLTADLSDLPAGTTATSQLTIVSNGGSLQVPIQVDILSPEESAFLLRSGCISLLLLLLLLLGGAFIGWRQWGVAEQVRGTAAAPISTTAEANTRTTPDVGASTSLPAIDTSAQHRLYLPIIYAETLDTATVSPLPTPNSLLPSPTPQPTSTATLFPRATSTPRLRPLRQLGVPIEPSVPRP